MGNQSTLKSQKVKEKKAFEGIRVYDASQGIAGPHAAMLMALHGAEVIKVEPPGGEWGRMLGRREGHQTIHSMAFNRGKKSIVLDLSSAEGKELGRRIAGQCDVFIESFRPGVVSRLGIGYEDIKKINPQIVYMSVSGFGQSGPYTKRAGVDGLIQAYSGMMVMNGDADGTPYRPNIIYIDIATGVYGFSALSAALMRRFRYQEGSYLDVNLMQTAAAFQAAKIMEYHSENGSPPPLYTPSGIFATTDGYILVSAMRDAHYFKLCEKLERLDLRNDPRYVDIPGRNKHAAPLVVELRKEFLKKSCKEWLDLLLEAGVMIEICNSYGDWLQDEHVLDVEAFDWVDGQGFGQLPLANIPGITAYKDAPETIRAPDPGDHSRAILADFGCDEEEIERFLHDGIVTEAHNVPD